MIVLQVQSKVRKWGVLNTDQANYIDCTRYGHTMRKQTIAKTRIWLLVWAEMNRVKGGWELEVRRVKQHYGGEHLQWKRAGTRDHSVARERGECRGLLMSHSQ